MGERGRQREFDDPIPLPDGRVLVTLRDAATYITGLPKKEAALPEWQTAIEALMLVVEHDDPGEKRHELNHGRTMAACGSVATHSTGFTREGCDGHYRRTFYREARPWASGSSTGRLFCQELREIYVLAKD